VVQGYALAPWPSEQIKRSRVFHILLHSMAASQPLYLRELNLPVPFSGGNQD